MTVLLRYKGINFKFDRFVLDAARIAADRTVVPQLRLEHWDHLISLAKVVQLTTILWDP